MEFPKKYNFKEKEPEWQKFWLNNRTYAWQDDQPRSNTYVVDTPPPTVSGDLHIGHVYSYAQTDFMVRCKRMKGMDIFYPMGFDDNGLPTERLVEKKKKLKASKMDRGEFVEICKEVVVSEEEKFRELFNSIALSVDWEQEYQTISPVSRKISQLSFLDLVNKGQVYRNAQPILWDPVDQTALAQADIEDKERSSFMNDVEFKTESGEKITIATTRPELLPACVSVFFHPDDERYKHLAGQYAITPLFNVKVPLLADDLVNPEKGTGLVMCCTFGDQTDILWWRKHQLPCKIIINKYGKMDDISLDETCLDSASATKYAAEITGLKVRDARSKMIELLRDNGSLVDQTEITQTVKCAERSGAPLEIITTPQWFIKTIDHKEVLKKRSNELNWHPETMKIKLDTWIDSISWDWCISRQRFFGVPFPVWYSRREGEEGKPIFASPEQLPVDPISSTPIGYELHEVIADTDVMDTWSTSSVSPQLNSHGIAKGLMENEKRHKKLFPADLRPQGHEILRTWAFYTILKAHQHEDMLPWSDIMVSGWCLAEDRSKMSKSKGNVIIPEKLLEQFGADVVRYWSASSRLGADTVYSEDVLKSGKRLVNKLWNAAKFVSTHFPNFADKYKKVRLEKIESEIVCDYDKYFLSKLQQVVEQVTAEYERYEYALAMLKLENFFWKEFCDNYLEITKSRAYNESGDDNDGQKSAIITLYHSLEIMLRLFAPVMPHITEELYQILYANEQLQSIHQRGNWPTLSLNKVDERVITQSSLLVEILELVRKAKANANLSIKAPIELLEIKAIDKFTDNLISDLKDVTSAKVIAFTDSLSTDTPVEGDNISINIVYSDRETGLLQSA